MKLNFWQWLGVLLIVAGIGWWLLDRRTRPEPSPSPTTTPAFDRPAPSDS